MCISAYLLAGDGCRHASLASLSATLFSLREIHTISTRCTSFCRAARRSRARRSSGCKWTALHVQNPLTCWTTSLESIQIRTRSMVRFICSGISSWEMKRGSFSSASSRPSYSASLLVADGRWRVHWASTVVEEDSSPALKVAHAPEPATLPFFEAPSVCTVKMYMLTCVLSV